MNSQNKDWFESWFDTPWYHVLYRERDQSEAGRFLDRLIEYLNPKVRAKFLDVACGKGRHSIYLNKKGFDVTGIDLSEQNIQRANESSNEHIRFFQHDMREPFEGEFDVVVNLFTSFGYFENDQDNQVSIQRMAESTVEGGRVVIDFMNTKKIIMGLIPDERKVIDGIEFHIQRELKDGRIVKHISFKTDGKTHQYSEYVRALTLDDFYVYFQRAGLKILDIFGDYELNDYNAIKSDRLILIAQK
jgi:SAM-dependent methyltransferase